MWQRSCLTPHFVLANYSRRHTLGTRLNESGVDAFTIMKLMGHSTVTISERYVHPFPEALEPVFEQLIIMNRPQIPQKVSTLLAGISGDKLQVA
jgi:hypothetical protein